MGSSLSTGKGDDAAAAASTAGAGPGRPRRVHLQTHVLQLRRLLNKRAAGSAMRLFVEVSHGAKVFRSPVRQSESNEPSWEPADTAWTFELDSTHRDKSGSVVSLGKREEDAGSSDADAENAGGDNAAADEAEARPDFLRVEVVDQTLHGWSVVGHGEVTVDDLVASGPGGKWVPLFRQGSSVEEAGEARLAGLYRHPSRKSLLRMDGDGDGKAVAA